MGAGDSGQPQALWEAVQSLAPDAPLGSSTEGRPICGVRVGDAGAPATLLVVAGVHGDEPASVAGVVELLERLRDGTLVAARPFWLIPALNPDGLLGGRKNNARDVDLNRNFPARNFTTQDRKSVV